MINRQGPVTILFIETVAAFDNALFPCIQVCDEAMRKRSRETAAVLLLAGSIAYQAQGAHSRKDTAHLGDGGFISDGNLRGSYALRETRGDVDDLVNIPALSSEINTTVVLGESLLSNAETTTLFDLSHAQVYHQHRHPGDWAGSTCPSSDAAAAKEEPDDKATHEIVVTAPAGGADPVPSKKHADAGESAPIIPDPYEERDRPNMPDMQGGESCLTTAQCANPKSNSDSIASQLPTQFHDDDDDDDDDEKKTTTTTNSMSQSLAPGWKQQSSSATGGAVMWIGGLMFALVWTALLC
jgi:hypothetical protein